METLSLDDPVEVIDCDGPYARYIPAQWQAATDGKIWVKLEQDSASAQASAFEPTYKTVQVLPRHVRPAPPDAACGPLCAGQSLDAKQGSSWVRVLAVGNADTSGGVPVIYEENCKTATVPLSKLRPGLEYDVSIPKPCWKQRSLDTTCEAISAHLATHGATGYLGILEAFPPGSTAEVYYRPKVTSTELRVLMTVKEQAVAARWRDALLDRHENWDAPRNFTPWTWQLAAARLKLDPLMSFTLPARPSGRNSTQGSMTMTGDITTASQGPSMSGAKRGRPLQQEQGSDSSKRAASASPGPRCEAAAAAAAAAAAGGSSGQLPHYSNMVPAHRSSSGSLQRGAGVPHPSSSHVPPSRASRWFATPAGHAGGVPVPAAAGAAPGGSQQGISGSAGGQQRNSNADSAKHLSSKLGTLSAGKRTPSDGSTQQHASRLHNGSYQLMHAAAGAAAVAEGGGGGRSPATPPTHTGQQAAPAAGGIASSAGGASGKGHVGAAGFSRPPLDPTSTTQWQRQPQPQAAQAMNLHRGGASSHHSRDSQGRPRLPAGLLVPAAAAGSGGGGGGGKEVLGGASSGGAGRPMGGTGGGNAAMVAAAPAAGVGHEEGAVAAAGAAGVGAAAAAASAGRLTGTRPPAAPLPRQPSTNGRQDQQQQPPPLQQQQQQQQQGLLVQEEAAALSSQARRWEARRKAREAAEAADKRLFSHGEELWLNMEGQHGTSKVQLQVDVYLGRGGYGVVYRVEEQVALTGAAAAIAAAGGQEANSAGQRLQRALKIVRPYELQQLVRGEEFKTTKADYLMECEADMQQEQKVLSKAADPVAHPCIVECYQRGWVEVRGHGFYPALLLEYCPGGSLEDLMRREGPQLSYERTRRFMIEVCYGVRFLHEIGIAHRDIKPANLLLTGMPGEEQVKLADLGCALEVTKARVCGQPVCTPAYRAPEMAENGWHDERVDSWLVGCLLLHLRSGKVPWHFLKEGEEGRRGAAQLDNPASPYYSELGLTDVEKKVLRDCLADQSFRPPVSELMLKHPKYFVLFSI